MDSMINERFRVSILLFSGALACIAPQYSHAEGAETDRTEGRRLFDEANAAFEEGRLGHARELLERSLEVFAHPSTAYNLALVLQRIGETHLAVEVLEGLLDGRHGTPDTLHHREASSLLETVRLELATVVIRVEGPPETEVRVDGLLIGTAGEPSVLETTVNAGHHRVVATAPHHAPAEEELHVNRGERVELTTTPVPHPGTLVLETEPDTELEVAGFERGRGSLRLELTPGLYTVRLIRRRRSRETEVEVRPGQSLSVRIEPPSTSFWRHPATWIVFGTLVASSVGIGLWLGLREPDEDPRILWQVEALSHQ